MRVLTDEEREYLYQSSHELVKIFCYKEMMG